MRDRIAPIMRFAGVILLLCVLACAQTASLAQVHSHERSSQHCCRVCHAGPLPFEAISVGAAGLPALAIIWLAPSDDCDGIRDLLAAAASSRAPPA